MYRKKDKSKQTQLQMLCIEDLVPQDHMLREIENAIDWSFIYDEVKGLYKEAEWGNPGIDPVVLFKIVFIQYLYGIRSMRQTIKEIEVNIAYRWFIGYDLTEPIPHFSTFGKNYKRRFEGTDIFERIFRHILEEAVKDERYTERQERLKPVLDGLFVWLSDLPVSGGTKLARAIQYCLNEKAYLYRCLENGNIPVDNNRAENAIRPFVVGRKNWLFANSPKGAEASAVIYSLAATATANGFNVEEYFTKLCKAERILPWDTNKA